MLLYEQQGKEEYPQSEQLTHSKVHLNWVQW